MADHDPLATRNPLELLPHLGLCLYDDERKLLEDLTAGLNDHDDESDVIFLTRREAAVVRHALERLSALRLRRLEDLGRPDPDTPAAA